MPGLSGLEGAASATARAAESETSHLGVIRGEAEFHQKLHTTGAQAAPQGARQDLPYDLELLKGAPSPTRSERQNGYDTALLGQSTHQAPIAERSGPANYNPHIVSPRPRYGYNIHNFDGIHATQEPRAETSEAVRGGTNLSPKAVAGLAGLAGGAGATALALGLGLGLGLDPKSDTAVFTQPVARKPEG